ncbi:MAG: hypothetical protein ACYTG1_04575 [Planctomycetota bacterium]|jgi:hypothetical protein
MRRVLSRLLARRRAPGRRSRETERRLATRALADAINRALDLGHLTHAAQLADDAPHHVDDPRLVEGLARLHLAWNDAESALARVDLCPGTTPALRLLRAACLVQLGGRAVARRELRAWTRSRRAPVEARLMLALLDWEEGDVHGATLAVLKNRPRLEDPRSLELLLLIAVAEQRPEQARVWADRLEALGPSATIGRAVLGLEDRSVAPTTAGAVATLADEIRHAEDVLPALVEAQRLEPDPATALLIKRAVLRAFDDLRDQPTALACFARLTAAPDDRDGVLATIAPGEPGAHVRERAA